MVYLKNKNVSFFYYCSGFSTSFIFTDVLTEILVCHCYMAPSLDIQEYVIYLPTLKGTVGNNTEVGCRACLWNDLKPGVIVMLNA